VSDWENVGTEFENVLYLTKIDDEERGPRNETILKRNGNLWYVKDGSSYVYYTPTHYKVIK